MRRRDFIAALGWVAAMPFAAHAQQSDRRRRIGILMGVGENDPDAQTRVATFKRGLQELNWIEDRNAHIDLRWGRGDAVRVQALANELVALAPDVILATNTPTARALKQATATTPIVFAGLADPIADGIVASLAKPAGNITGFTSFNAAIAGKWLQILKEISPSIDRILVLYNPSTAPFAAFLPTMQVVAPQIGVVLDQAPVADRAAIEEVLTRFVSMPGGGLVLMPDVFTVSHRDLIFGIANRGRLPTMCPTRIYTAAGGLVSYSSNFNDLFSQSAGYVDRILKGEKPGDLPVQEPTRYELIVNLKTAKALGLTVPTSLLATADELIE